MLSKVFAALDTKDREFAMDFASSIADVDALGIKLGLEFVHSCGHDAVKQIVDMGCEVFLDLKFHDIPNTVSQATVAVARLGVTVMNLHASGGRTMMESAKDSLHAECAKLGIEAPRLISITVLTSLDNHDLTNVGQIGPTNEQALRLAKLTADSGLDGVVCSGADLSAIRQSLGTEFITIVPGIRLESQGHDDQKRIMTPRSAIDQGATALVVGRAITNAEDPRRVAVEILEQIG